MFTKILKQYREMKAKHPDALLLFRNDDNHPATYDLFNEDAISVGQIIERETTQIDETTVLLSFPHHALDIILPQFVRTGRRVAICEQLKDPRQSRKLVKRGRITL